MAFLVHCDTSGRSQLVGDFDGIPEPPQSARPTFDVGCRFDWSPCDGVAEAIPVQVAWLSRPPETTEARELLHRLQRGYIAATQMIQKCTDYRVAATEVPPSAARIVAEPDRLSTILRASTKWSTRISPGKTRVEKVFRENPAELWPMGLSVVETLVTLDVDENETTFNRKRNDEKRNP